MAEGLVKSGDIQGIHLIGRQGVKLGSVRETFIDLASGRVAFLVIEMGGLLGGSGKFHPVPWAAVKWDAVAGAFQADVTKDDFKAAPSYDREQLANPGYGWDTQALTHFSAARAPADT